MRPKTSTLLIIGTLVSTALALAVTIAADVPSPSVRYEIAALQNYHVAGGQKAEDPTSKNAVRDLIVPDIPEVMRLRLENGQLAANLATRDAQLAQKVYEQRLQEIAAAMSKDMTAFEVANPGWVIDTAAKPMKAVKKVAK